MLDIRRHKWLIILVAAFAVAWSMWTFFLLPASETPSLPDAPVQDAPNQ